MKKMIKLLCAVLAAVTALSGISAMAADNYGYGYGYSYGGRGNQSTRTNVSFFIQINGDQLDSNGNVSGRDKSFFTDVIATSTLKTQLSSNYSVVIGNGVTQEDVLYNVKTVPDDNDVFEKVVKQYKEKDAYLRSSNGKIIPWSKLTEDYYKVQWYVLKSESDGWHVDGVIIERETDKEISIVVPEESAERATCVEYDVRTGLFTPGMMNIKANRPHSQWRGDNDTLIMDGFEDVWYTVLDEETFEANSYVIPQELMDAATAVSKLANARLSELNPTLQKQYGRIDSQAYKQEYITRNGKTTLYVTPFISERLTSRYGVNNDKYIWLAMGDSQGNVQKVYVMDRNAADIDNMFDEE